MPKPNRPLVRDGRLQAPKKRTDRSYLRPSAPKPDSAAAPDEIVADIDDDAELPLQETEPVAEPLAAFVPPATMPVIVPDAPRAGKLPTTVRAIQQQGVRKRRDVDLKALAARDTSYAFHELRRIAVLASMVVVTLVVLWFVLR